MLWNSGFHDSPVAIRVFQQADPTKVRNLFTAIGIIAHLNHE